MTAWKYKNNIQKTREAIKEISNKQMQFSNNITQGIICKNQKVWSKNYSQLI